MSLEESQLQKRTVARGDGDTASPVATTIEHSTQQQAGEHEGRISAAQRVGRGVEVGAIIGEGGMGVIHLGHQNSVGREVAIKTVKQGMSSLGLLEEAWVTGRLEHPNIVPVHDITVGADGRAQVVLKRIEGVEWSALINQPERVRRRFGSSDVLQWHLRVLIQICQALRFAHSRGVLHRDVKPDNVMIGRFDEVYLLDWGLALSTEPSDQLPMLRDAYNIAGSPAYMAPEQFDDDPGRIGFHTDIYLLGSTLYEIVAGEPPHSGAHLAQIRAQIESRRQPPLPADVAPELVSIIRRAMAFEPERRFASVQAFREAIEGYLEHRGSQQLATQAAVRGDDMRQLQKARDDEGAARAFVEAAFGYRMALKEWQDNELARVQLATLVRDRVESLLAQQSPHAAQRAFDVVEAPDPELVARVEQALAKEALERKTLRRLARDVDRRVGYRIRRLFVIILGGGWAAFWITMGFDPPASITPLIWATLGFAAPTVAAGLYFRRLMLNVRLNRYISWIVAATFGTQVLWLIGAGALMLPVNVTIATLLMLWFMTLAVAAATVEVRILPAAAAHAVAFIGCAFKLSLLPWALAVTSVVLLLNMMGINLVLARQGPSPLEAPSTRQ